ncbi:glycoside hydrolase superfamily [Penicillium taxi]|uniref:glycoside hydrolase superfamily n=1 Tax=Penicillium taxi TaxID=168475 RepID=UPI0025453DEA|nr:glycoside hydrolase superfamily [Penicillium taxi]KAJ5894934.1 glycoside hydrolase superfamily [Penicillium taxi]
MLLQPSLCCWAGFISVTGFFGSTLAASTAEWKRRSVYQTMTDRFARTDGSTTHACNTTAGLYCGGTWRGMINHLDYIQGMGFDAVMISPIIENIAGSVSYGEAYHGYWPSDFNALNTNFGTKQDLLDLSAALHDRDMYLLMDTVINNMAYITNGENPATHIDYSVFKPFNNADYFHTYCKITDWENMTNAQLCQTGDTSVALPDLYTEHEDVQTLLENWASSAIDTYSIDGLRIDAAKHVTPSFLKNFGDKVGGFMTGEVLEQDPNIICSYQEKYIESLPNYPIYYAMLEAFTLGNVSRLGQISQVMKSSCPDVTALSMFSENHDQARIASKTKDMSLAKNILAFTILFDGVPLIYQGQEQHLSGNGVPGNREAIWLSDGGYNTDAPLYKFIKTLNLIRRQANKLSPTFADTASYPIYQGSSEIAFTKGVEGQQMIMLLNNQGANGGSYDFKLTNTYAGNTTVTDVLTCANYTVNEYAEIELTLDKGLPHVFYPTYLMPGSGLCGHSSNNISYEDLATSRYSAGVLNKGASDYAIWVALLSTAMAFMTIL